MAFDDLSARAASVANWAALVATRAPEPTTAARANLDAMVFTAGVHKFLDPLSWSAYVVPWLAPVLVVPPVTFVFANGILEVDFDAAIVTDRYTAPVSTVAAVSLSTMYLYLTAVFVVEGGLFGDVFAHDVGFTGLAWAVLADSLRRPTRTP